MSHHVVVKFPCKEGKGEEFLSVLKGALVDTRAFEGVQLVDVYVCLLYTSDAADE